MANFEFKTDREKVVGDVTSALSELRDALVELSLALRDWQFETDVEQRKKSEALVQQLLRKFSSVHGPSTS